MKNLQKISIVSAYPTEGAGSGTLITAQAKTYVEQGLNVSIITANNNTGFKKLPGVNYVLVPFTGEKEPIEKLEGALPFNFVMFTSHTNSKENFWNIDISQLNLYCRKFQEIFATHVSTEKPDVFHGQHCWISTALLTDYKVPVITTIHGTDMMGYSRAKDELKAISDIINIDYSKVDLEKIYLAIISEDVLSEATKAEIEKIALDNLTEEALNEIQAKISFTGSTPSSLKEKIAIYNFYIYMAEKAARNSKEIWVISFEQEKKFKSLFPFAADKVKLVRNGCDTTVYYKENNVDAKELLASLTSNITPDGKIPTDYDKLAIFVGKFAGFKRVDLILDAAKIYEDEMQAKGIKVLTLIVGSGALDEDLKAQQKELGLNNTHFVGRQGPDVVRKLQNIADVFLAPSDNEPDGLVYKECMLCGNIAIGTLGGGVPDTINPENIKLTTPEGYSDIYPTKYGILIPMDNSEALATATMYALEHSENFVRSEIIDYAKEYYDQRNISKNVIIPEFTKVINVE